MPGSNSNLHRKIATLCVVLFVGVLAGYFALGWGIYYWKEYVHHYESGAESELLALHTIQENYKKDHGSYAGTFSQLGVPLGAKLNSDALIWSGPYVFRIVGIVQNQDGSIVEYSIDARPVTYSSNSKRSYLMDQTGMIHFTTRNRDAVNGDQRIPGQR